MAPEIREGRVYDGIQVDLFSLGVIVYQIVQGTSPFSAATKDDLYYSQLVSRQTDTFFELLNAQHLSAEFKDLVSRLLAYDASRRLSIDELRSHPWLCQKIVIIDIQAPSKKFKSNSKNFVIKGE